ncbi:MAG: FAD-dependent oxidoreductase [Deltaproteobacteria bacterium]|nr:FAD-dependent oxidoreductase [Deltaproteobacteria bacterium]
MKKQKVAIVGGGILGRLLALTLIERREDKLELSLFDKNIESGFGSCSFTAAGMLAPFAELEKAETEVFKLGFESLSLWPLILKKWCCDVFYRNSGTLVVAHTQEQQDLDLLSSKMRKYENYSSEIQPLTSSDIQNLEPDLSKKFQRGLYICHEAHLDVRALLPSLSQALSAYRNVHQNFGIYVDDVQAGKILLGNQWVDFDWVFDCRGLGAQGALHGLRGVRGEIMKVRAPEVLLNRPIRLLHPRYPLYVVPLENQEYILGATLIESESTDNISVQSVLELLSAAYSIHSGFAEAQVLEFSAQLRPAFSDHCPRVIVEDQKFLRINGLYRHGYLVSPALCEKVVSIFCEVK